MDSEIVIGLVCPVGINHADVVQTLTLTLEQFRYKANPIRISELFPRLFADLGKTWDPPATQSETAAYKIEAGNKIREWTGHNDALALAAARHIASLRTVAPPRAAQETNPSHSFTAEKLPPPDAPDRPTNPVQAGQLTPSAIPPQRTDPLPSTQQYSPPPNPPHPAANPVQAGHFTPSTLPPHRAEPLPRTAHIITSLKRPEEVATLREIYGAGFFLIALSASRRQREQYFEDRGMKGAADELIAKDTAESGQWGQQTRETFHLADVFVSMDDARNQLIRFLDLLFGRPTLTPTAHEHAMFTAYAASLRSGDLSRQVGAAIVDNRGDLLAVGCNEAPRPGGGLYGPEPNSHRDIEEGHDSNERAKDEMIQSVLAALGRTDLDKKEARRLLKPTGLTDITEFGRAVHAEMEALLACARTGRTPRGGTLFSTTFPCHNCCRHIIAAGIASVVYIEPYPKSRAPNLHGDAISIDESEPVPGKLPFQPFIGVGPRRYFDLFSLRLSTGEPLTRKKDGLLKPWSRETASLRLPMRPDSYLDRESN